METRDRTFFRPRTISQAHVFCLFFQVRSPLSLLPLQLQLLRSHGPRASRNLFAFRHEMNTNQRSSFWSLWLIPSDDYSICTFISYILLTNIYRYLLDDVGICCTLLSTGLIAWIKLFPLPVVSLFCYHFILRPSKFLTGDNENRYLMLSLRSFHEWSNFEILLIPRTLLCRREHLFLSPLFPMLFEGIVKARQSRISLSKNGKIWNMKLLAIRCY